MKTTGIITCILIGTLAGFLFVSLVPKPPFADSQMDTSASSSSSHKRVKDGRLPRGKSLKPSFEPFPLQEILARVNTFGRETNPILADIKLRHSLMMLTDEELDGERLIDLFESSGQPNTFRDVVKVLFARMARKDPHAAVDAMMKLKHTQLQYVALYGVFEAWAETDPEACWVYIKGQPSGFIRNYAPARFLGVMAKKDPLGALERAFSLKNVAFEGSAVRNIMYTWVANDSEAAIQYAMGRENEAERSRLLGAAIDSLASKDRPAAFELALSLPDQRNGDFHLRKIIQQWVVMDPEAAKAALLGLPEERLNEQVVYEFATSFTMSNRDGAVSFASEIPEGKLRDHYWERVVTARGWKNPADAAQLVENLPEGKHRNEALDNLMQSWVGKDEVGAATWLAELPESPSRDVAVGSFSRRLFALNPGSAVEWAASISDEKRRDYQVNRLLKQWQEKDAAAAEEWMQHHDR